MEIFLDTGNIREVEKFIDIIDGVTTNPTLIHNASTTNIEFLIETADKWDIPIFIEIMQEGVADMCIAAKELVKINPNVIVKIPPTVAGYSSLDTLHNHGIITNLTIVTSVFQALLAAKKGCRYLSIFKGLVDDEYGRGKGLELLTETRTAVHYNYPTKIIAASIREYEDIREVVSVDIDAITIPPIVLEASIENGLSMKRLEKFKEDWKKWKK